MCSKTKGTCTSDPETPKICRESYLFLLEFYIREIKSPRLVKLNQMFCVPTTVAFTFLDFEPDEDMQLTPVDPMFVPQSGIADDVEPFYGGRSVVFALDQDTVCSMCLEMKLQLRVMKKMPRDIRPDVMIGYSVIDLTTLFQALRKEIIENQRYPEESVPNPSKTYESDVPMILCDAVTGTVDAFARLSAYGQTIVTEFEAPSSCSTSSFLFKSGEAGLDEANPGYKCRLVDHCNVSEILRDNGEYEKTPKCTGCKPPKLPCSPCCQQGADLARRPMCAPPDKCRKSEPPACPAPDPCKPIQTSRGPKESCGKAVVLKVSGLVDTCDPSCGDSKPAIVTVAPESEAATAKDLLDPDHDIFILRIGKKGLVGAGEKSDIQLEMRTPKGPERRRPIRLETREQQTEDNKKSRKPKKS